MWAGHFINPAGHLVFWKENLMGKLVSMREYARIRGVNLNAVQTAIKSGRIHKTRDDKIDVDEANREWFMNTDQAQQRKPDPLFEGQGGVRMSNMGTFQQAKTADIYYRAMLAKAKLKMLTGEMVDRKRAGNYAFNLGRALRDLFMSFPVRYGALIAAELGTDEHQTSAVLDEYIRKMLTESQDILSKELWKSAQL